MCNEYNLIGSHFIDFILRIFHYLVDAAWIPARLANWEFLDLHFLGLCYEVCTVCNI